MRVVVVGAGISGLVSAYVLVTAGVKVVLYEKENNLGGHAKTITMDGADLDLKFTVFNRVTSPNMMEFFEKLGVDMEISDMSFSMSLGEGNGFEWGTRNGLSSLFSQKRNLLNPYFLKMLWELATFKDDVLRYLESNQDVGGNETLWDFIKSHGYSQLFQKAYLVPICSSFWPNPEGVMRLSAVYVLSHIRNHYLFQLFNPPQWLVVKGGSQAYIKKVTEELESGGCQIRTTCVVQSVSKVDDGCVVVCDDGSQEKYHGCIIDADAPDILSMLGEEATHEEKRILGAFQYFNSDIFLHHDKDLVPKNQTAWSALNFSETKDEKVCLTYWLNVLQNIDRNGLPFFVTHNPPRTPKSTLLKWSTRQPIPTVAASKAALELHHIQGKRGIWFCSAYQGYGFQDDGLKAGMIAANGMLNKSCEILCNPKYMVPSFVEAGARKFVVSFLQDYIDVGTLILLEEGGNTFTFEGTTKNTSLRVYMKIHNPRFYWKVVTEADLGFADAYINGDFSMVDKKEGLLHLIMIFIINSDSKKYASRGWWTPVLSTAMIASAKSFYRHVLRQNTLTQARRNISHHYDMSNELFALFLDETMSYSSAIFKSEDEDLKSAQMRKIYSLIDKARVDKKHHVLDIGCGWGSFAIEIVKQTGCSYTGITLSEEQLTYAQKKVKEVGLQDHIKFLLCDYRKLPHTFKFDRIISCEMIEHVGHEYYEEFFECCESVLTEDGIFVLQFISVPDERYDEFRRSVGFMKEHIFPGGCMPSLSRLTSAMATSSRLCVDHVEKIGPHYYHTLKHWRANLMKNQSKILALGFNQEFIRTWEYYIDYCAAAFKTERFGDYQVVFSRPRTIAMLGDADKGVVSAY